MAYVTLTITAAILFLSAYGYAEDRCYEEVEDHALFGNNDNKIQHVSLTECKRLCDDEESFTCISLDYTTSSTCYLSSNSHVTEPDMYGPHFGATYAYVTQCAEEDSSEQTETEESESEEGPDDEGSSEVETEEKLPIDLCEDSSHYESDTCDKVFDGDTDTWWQVPMSDTGEWIKLYLGQTSHVTRMTVWSYPTTMGQCSVLRFTFNDRGKRIEKTRDCYESPRAIADTFYFDDVVTRDVKLTCIERCPYGVSGWYLFSEIDVYGTATADSIPEMTCDESSQYSADNCDKLTDGDLNTWWQIPTSDVGEWVRFDFSTPRTVQRIDYWNHMLVQGQCGTLEFEFSGGEVSRMTRECRETATPKLESFYVDIAETDYVKMKCYRRCPYGTRGWYLFAEISIQSDGDADVIEVTGDGITIHEPVPIELENGYIDDVIRCSDSSHYQSDTCHNLYDHDADSWWQVPGSANGEWAELTFSQSWSIDRLDIWNHKRRMGQCETIVFEFSDDVKQYSGPCYESDGPIKDTFRFSTVVTDSIKMTCTRRCSDAEHGWYLFSEIVPYAASNHGDGRKRAIGYRNDERVLRGNHGYNTAKKRYDHHSNKVRSNTGPVVKKRGRYYKATRQDLRDGLRQI